MRERWRIETETALIGWQFARVMAETPPDRPDLPDWPEVRNRFDEWLVSDPESVAMQEEDSDLSPEQLDIMVAYGWRE